MGDVTKPTSRFIVVSAAMAAAVFVGTFLVRVPIPATNGYLNLGDPFIVMAGLLFGPGVGAVAGGVGSAAADVIGFPVFAVPTLLIKGAAGMLVGFIGYRRGAARAVIAAMTGEALVVAGYFGVEALVFKSSMGLPAALTELPFNVVQALFGAGLGLAAWFALARRQTEGRSSPQGE